MILEAPTATVVSWLMGMVQAFKPVPATQSRCEPVETVGQRSDATIWL